MEEAWAHAYANQAKAILSGIDLIELTPVILRPGPATISDFRSNA